MNEHLMELRTVDGHTWTVAEWSEETYLRLVGGERVLIQNRAGDPWTIDSDHVIAFRLIPNPEYLPVDNTVEAVES